MPLPPVDRAGDKEHRGTVLVVGGSPQMAGAALLSATAALRVGAGKLMIATVGSVAKLVATAMPEAFVEPLPETREGALTEGAIAHIAKKARDADALVIGPGLVEGDAIARWTPRLFAAVAKTRATLVVDAEALVTLSTHPRALHPLGERAIVTPHAGEMAALLGTRKADVLRGAASIASSTASDFRAVVALKGATTFIASPHGELYRNDAGNPGLGTSGSGDVLAGAIAGLAARGADPLRAAVWGVRLHAIAGDVLAKRQGGPLGFLARELLDVLPSVMAKVATR